MNSKRIMIFGYFLVIAFSVLTVYVALFYVPTTILNQLKSLLQNTNQVENILSNTVILIPISLLPLICISIGFPLYLYLIFRKDGEREVIEVIRYHNAKEENSVVVDQQISVQKMSVEDVITHFEESFETEWKYLSIEQGLEKLLSAIANMMQASIGAFYKAEEINSKRCIRFVAGFAFQLPDSQELIYEYGEGIAGQVAKQKEKMLVRNVPSHYLQINSGLGSTAPTTLIANPLMNSNSLIGVIELASFKEYTEKDLELLEKIAPIFLKIISNEGNASISLD